MMNEKNVSRLLLLVAVLCFVLTAFGVGAFIGINLLALGLAFFAASFLV